MYISEKINFAGKELEVQSGKIAKQASGSCIIKYGESVIFVAVTSSKGEEEDRGFFPLSVDYREKFYASGRIPGGFFKREARPSEKEILASRLTDRPLRPLFEDGFNNETRVDITVLSYDNVNEPDIFAAFGASYALMISDIPFKKAIASVRVGNIDNEMVINPTKEQLNESKYELILSGTYDSIVMVEGKCDFVSEDEVLTAIQYGHEAIKDLIKFQEKLVSKHDVTKRTISKVEIDEELINKIDQLVSNDVKDLNKPKNKHDRYSDIDKYITSKISELEEEYPDSSSIIKNHIDNLIANDLRNTAIKENVRADGRNSTTVREINVETSLLPRTHGSSLFTRGETQAMVIATLGGKRDEQMLDNIEGLDYKRFLLHYNFPSYCVGEARGKFSLSRREVGHGNLAERAIYPSLPDYEDFPYTIRLVSEIMESNGSSSMASVCGSSLALMDAGVPLKAPIAGVAMGLIMDDKGKYVILTDILGTEDHIGDMDFKVAGSKDGITAIQMDIKIDGLSYEILGNALEQAKDGRLHILNEMSKDIDSHRTTLSDYAPKIGMSTIPVDMIGEFIGPGGKNIKALAEKYSCEINIDDDGSCTVLSTEQSDIDSVIKYIDDLTRTISKNEVLSGEVVRIVDFGAFVKLTPNKDGLLHISEIKKERVNKVTDCLQIGDKVDVKVLKVDNGKISLSMKALLKD